MGFVVRNIIIGKSFVGFVAMRDEFDLGDKIGHGDTEIEALEHLLFLEESKNDNT